MKNLDVNFVNQHYTLYYINPEKQKLHVGKVEAHV
jgi:hypothetical protein